LVRRDNPAAQILWEQCFAKVVRCVRRSVERKIERIREGWSREKEILS
jgi:hypothetical protein